MFPLALSRVVREGDAAGTVAVCVGREAGVAVGLGGAGFLGDSILVSVVSLLSLALALGFGLRVAVFGFGLFLAGDEVEEDFLLWVEREDEGGARTGGGWEGRFEEPEEVEGLESVSRRDSRKAAFISSSVIARTAPGSGRRVAARRATVTKSGVLPTGREW